MTNYELHIRIDDSYEIVEQIVANNAYNAMIMVKEKIKRERTPKSIWVHEMKIIK